MPNTKLLRLTDVTLADKLAFYTLQDFLHGIDLRSLDGDIPSQMFQLWVFGQQLPLTLFHLWGEMATVGKDKKSKKQTTNNAFQTRNT